jgi:hypothetical protein
MLLAPAALTEKRFAQMSAANAGRNLGIESHPVMSLWKIDEFRRAPEVDLSHIPQRLAPFRLNFHHAGHHHDEEY